MTTDEKFPQFMVCVGHQYLKPVEATDVRNSTGLLQILINKLTELFKNLFAKMNLPAFN